MQWIISIPQFTWVWSWPVALRQCLITNTGCGGGDVFCRSFAIFVISAASVVRMCCICVSVCYRRFICVLGHDHPRPHPPAWGQGQRRQLPGWDLPEPSRPQGWPRGWVIFQRFSHTEGWKVTYTPYNLFICWDISIRVSPMCLGGSSWFSRITVFGPGGLRDPMKS